MNNKQLENLTDAEINEKCHTLVGYNNCGIYQRYFSKRNIGGWIPVFDCPLRSQIMKDEGFQIADNPQPSLAYWDAGQAKAIPSYTTDFNDAFKLIKFAESEGFYAQIFTHNRSVCFYPVTKSGMVNIADIEFIKSDSIPKAIAKAFILSFEKE